MLLAFLRPYPWALPALVILGLLSSLSEGLGLGLLIPLLNTLLNESGQVNGNSGLLVEYSMAYAALFDESTRLFALCAMMIVLVMLKGVVQCGGAFVTADVVERVTHHLRMELVRRLFEVGYAHIAQRDRGTILNTLQGESTRTGQALSSLAYGIGAACAIIVFFILLLLISWQMTLAVCIGGVVGSIAVRALVKWGGHIGTRAVQGWDQLTERTIDILNGMRVIRIFTQEDREIARFERASDATRRAQRAALAIHTMTYPLMEVIYVPLLLGVLATGVMLDLAAPVIVTFLVLVYRMLPHVKNLDSNRVSLARYGKTIEVVSEALRRDDKPYLSHGSHRFEGLKSGITFEKVGFSYTQDQSRGALHDVSLEIGRGETVALVGRSGSGKSTLINLFCRLYDPSQGQILVDDLPLPEYEPRSWRSRISIAGQDAELMAGTIRDNIAFGREGATPDEIVAAAKQAHAHDFIESLPEGYETEVGPQGTRLSGGQRQRIGLARALVRRPDILILDEATNAVDALTESAIKKALSELPKGLTTLIIAHRLNTVQNADWVVVLDGGRIVEQGRPDELVRRKGAFADLTQAHQFEDALRT